MSDETKEILGIIAEAQKDCAPVELTIGTTTESGFVMAGGVYIKDCPSKIIEALISEGWVLSMDNGKLHPIFKRDDEDE